MIAAIKRGKQPIWVLGVTHDSIEVDDGIEMAWHANPRIYGLPIGLA